MVDEVVVDIEAAKEHGFGVVVVDTGRNKGVTYSKSNLMCRVRQALNYKELQLTELMFSRLLQAEILGEDVWHRISVEETALALEIEYDYAKELWAKNYNKLATIQHKVEGESHVINIVAEVRYNGTHIIYKLTQQGCDLLSGVGVSGSLIRKFGYIQKNKLLLGTKGKYTHQLYDLITSSLCGNLETTIPFSIFKEVLGIPPSYKSITNILRNIIEPAMEEINTCSGHRYNYELLCRGTRKITSIKFIKEKDIS